MAVLRACKYVSPCIHYYIVFSMNHRSCHALTRSSMASQEVSSKRSALRRAEYRKGTDTELLRIGGEPTTLFLLCGDRFNAARAFKLGDLSVHLIRVLGSLVSMASCMVGDHHWMLAKDSVALRVGARLFVFELPGFLYGLALPTRSSEQQVKRLEDIFARFCGYQDLAAIQERELVDVKSETNLWANAYSMIEKLAARTTGKLTVSSSSSVVDLTARKIQRAVRTSAVVKLVSRALLNGALSSIMHIHLSMAPGQPVVHGSIDTPHAFPSMWAIADVLDAVDTGCWLPMPPPRPRAPEGRDGCWYFNREGLALLLDIVKAYSATRAGMKRPRLEAVLE